MVLVVSEITRILQRASDGEAQAAEELLPLLYDELRKLAAAKLAREAPGQTLQPTALVHEAWLRLGGEQQSTWQGRAHFFAAAAEAMRRILVEKVREKGRIKRGAGIEPQPLKDQQIALGVPSEEILGVNEALDRLAAEDRTAAEVVKLRYFVGLQVREIAEVLNVSPRSVDRLWAFARLRLKQLIQTG